MRRADTQRRDSEGWRRAGHGGWRLDGEQQDSPSERRYIRAEEFLPFLPASFALFFSPSAPSPPDLGTDKEGEGTGGEGRQGGGEE